MGHQHQRYTLPIILLDPLDHGFNADAVVSKNAGNPRQYTGLIQDPESQKIFSLNLGYIFERYLLNLGCLKRLGEELGLLRLKLYFSQFRRHLPPQRFR